MMCDLHDALGRAVREASDQMVGDAVDAREIVRDNSDHEDGFEWTQGFSEGCFHCADVLLRTVEQALKDGPSTEPLDLCQ